MVEIPRDLIFSAIGSIIGALFVYFGQSGLQITKKARDKARKAREDERVAWKSMKLGIRQGITNQYLFSILRYLFLGNLLWLIPETASEPLQMLNVMYGVYICIIISARVGALLSFFLGLGRIIRYLRLRALDEIASPSQQ